MYRLKVFLVCFLILGNCANFQGQKTIQFKDGRTANVFFETRKADSGEDVFVVDFKNENIVTKETEIESDVIEIWNKVKTESEKAATDEGIIKYSFSTGEKDEHGERIFEGIMFIADRTENGEWSIKRVD